LGAAFFGAAFFGAAAFLGAAAFFGAALAGAFAATFFAATFFGAAFAGAFVAAFFVAIVVILPALHYETKVCKDKPKKLKNVSECVCGLESSQTRSSLRPAKGSGKRGIW
jgi:hypothetical protein